MGSDLSGSFDSPERPRSEALGRVCSTSEGNRGDLRFRENRAGSPAVALATEYARKIDVGLESKPGSFHFSIRSGPHAALPEVPDAVRRDPSGGPAPDAPFSREKDRLHAGLFPEVEPDYREKIRPDNPRRNCCAAAEKPYFFGVCAAAGALGMPWAVGTTV